MNEGTFDALTLAQIRQELAQLVAMADTTGRPKPDVINPPGHAMAGWEWRIAQDVQVDRFRPPLWLVRTIDDSEVRDCLYVAEPDPYRAYDWLQGLDFTAMSPTDARRLAMALLAAADRVDAQNTAVPSLVDRRQKKAGPPPPGHGPYRPPAPRPA
ncbi:hypothetical protein [Kitasatospora cineracea]|uniref:Uncharacterized protein n=1 Tax=Kitasatospora cineracea TaxID=88074 RepID=A0A3N4R225_9ACTN|nr:hypothetical protein [Kitasatospora cineracea]RPE27242.1 hypothetical protein EDD38_7386 [Kitasatospora cineracea]RPE27374.1 hypothetical protein EDD38_7519 [Kitasatospora cineracea]